jgi:2-keto-4-pentenoate hydratase/2-oxohepta-3-ene-1,7-dioic acid hydratase in catechol pathway
MAAARIELANLGGRAQLLRDGRVIDVHERSGGRFTADPMGVLRDWRAFLTWAREAEVRASDPALDATRLGPCVPEPGQVFGIGLNYRDHAEEAKIPVPKEPVVFTKFASCIAAPHADIALTSDRVDFEVELVVVIGEGGRDIAASDAPGRIAGYCVGQDVSDRKRQFADIPPQFSLGKSARGYGPIGPTLVAADALEYAQSLRLTCDVAGERMQDGNSRNMIFGIADLVAYLSRWCELRPGDLIFTGTPAGVGSVRDPRRYLVPGDVIESEIEGLGRLRNRCVAAPT